MIVGATAAAGIVAGFVAYPKPALALVGFQVVTLVACVIGVLFGRGAFSNAPGLCLACVSGTIAVAATLGSQSVQWRLGSGSILSWTALHLGLALVVAGVGAVLVLGRRAKTSWRRLMVGAALGVPVVLVVGSRVVPAGRGAWAWFGSLGPFVQTMIAVPAFLLLGALCCASVDLIIRAFEAGRTDEQPEA